MKAKRYDTAIRREQIADAALAIVNQEGLRRLSVIHLARRVGIGPSAIYRHFKGKDAILAAVLDRIEARMQADLNQACLAAETPIGRLEALLERHVQLIRENHAIPRIVFSEEVVGGHEGRRKRLYRLISGYLAGVADLIHSGQQHGSIRRDVPAATLATLFLGLIQPAAIIWHLSDGDFDVTGQVRAAWRLFVEHIQDDEGGPH